MEAGDSLVVLGTANQLGELARHAGAPARII